MIRPSLDFPVDDSLCEKGFLVFDNDDDNEGWQDMSTVGWVRRNDSSSCWSLASVLEQERQPPPPPAARHGSSHYEVDPPSSYRRCTDLRGKRTHHDAFCSLFGLLLMTLVVTVVILPSFLPPHVDPSRILQHSEIGHAWIKRRRQREQQRKQQRPRPQQQIVVNHIALDPIPKSTVLFDDGTIFYPLHGDPICDYFVSGRAHTPITRVHIHFHDCRDESKLARNLNDYFGAYLIANTAQVPFTMTCGNPHQNPPTTAMMHLMTDNRYPGPVPKDSRGKAFDSVQDLCVQYCSSLAPGCDKGLYLISDMMRETMQRMAAAVQSTPATSFESDDVVIHVRLGYSTLYPLSQAATARELPTSGLLPHQVYSKLIREIQTEKGYAETISIVTQSFAALEGSLTTLQQDQTRDRSELIARDLVEYLQETFPRATIRLHNRLDDSPTKAQARLVAAKKGAICGVSSFCTSPVLSVRNDYDSVSAIGYLLDGGSVTHRVEWAHWACENYLDVRKFSSPLLSNTVIPQLTDREILDWLRQQSPQVNGRPDDVIVTARPILV